MYMCKHTNIHRYLLTPDATFQPNLHNYVYISGYRQPTQIHTLSLSFFSLCHSPHAHTHVHTPTLGSWWWCQWTTGGCHGISCVGFQFYITSNGPCPLTLCHALSHTYTYTRTRTRIHTHTRTETPHTLTYVYVFFETFTHQAIDAAFWFNFLSHVLKTHILLRKVLFYISYSRINSQSVTHGSAHRHDMTLETLQTSRMSSW